MDAVHPDVCVTGDIYQEQECVMDDQLSGETEQILVHRLEQSRDQNHSQVISGHLVRLGEQLDSEEETPHPTVSDAAKLILTISRHEDFFLNALLSLTSRSVQTRHLMLLCCHQEVPGSAFGMLKTWFVHLKSLKRIYRFTAGATGTFHSGLLSQQ